VNHKISKNLQLLCEMIERNLCNQCYQFLNNHVGIYNHFYLVMLFAFKAFLSVSRLTMFFAATKILIAGDLIYFSGYLDFNIMAT